MATFTNQATLTYNGGSVTSNVATGEIVEVITVTKTALNDNYTAGDTVTYVINVNNTGATTLTNLTLDDNLGGYALADGNTVYPLTYVDGTARYFVNGAPQTDPAVTAGPPLTVTGLDIPAGGNATIIYEARVNGFAPLDNAGVINNTASVSGDGVNNPVTDLASVYANAAPELSINKSVSPATVAENGTLTYTFDIQNSGNTDADAGADVAVTDTFDPILNNITVTYNGTPWVEGTNYTYDPATGEFATIPGQITVPAAGYTRNAANGSISTDPGVGTLVVSGTI